MNVETLIARARSGVGKRTKYESPGKLPPFGASSWTQGAKNDCSGFVDWCLRFSPSRQVDHPLYKRVNGGWFETTAIYADGLEAVGYFKRLDEAKPGAMLVYPDYIGNDGKSHDGHIGIVLEAHKAGVQGVKSVIHCSWGQWKSTGDAVQITGPEAWKSHKESIIVWFEGLEE
jgi:hypothetical protein